MDDNLSLKIDRKDKNGQLEDTNTSDDSSYGGVCEGQLPVVGFVQSTQPCNLVVYSLKSETSIHIWRFGSSILKFKSSLKNTSNKVVVLLREGILQVMSLKTMG